VYSGENDAKWPATHAGGDQASSTLAWFLFADLPGLFISNEGGSDRAEMLERTWESSWPDETLGDPLDEVDAVATSDKPLPLLLLNGTRVQDGCRVDISILSATAAAGGSGAALSDCLTVRQFRSGAVQSPDWTFAATQDISAYLCDSQLPLSTAALLSARFPWVSPSGRVPPCDGKKDILETMNVVDGGYFDTSAASTIVELWDHLRPEIERYNTDPAHARCIVPVLVELDNHYASYTPRGVKKPWETGVPLDTLQAARNAREANARQAAALAFGGPLPGNQRAVRLDGADVVSSLRRFEELRPAAHPGTEAPLGWTLSSASLDDLHDQLVYQSPANNPQALAAIQSWFQPNAVGCDARG
jgi:hypothetical protein